MENAIEIIKSIEQWAAPVLGTIVVILGIRTIGYKLASRIFLSLCKWIKELEADTSLSGPEKMKLVVSYTKNLIPRFFRVIFNDQAIQVMADAVFEDMQAYSELRVQKKTGLTWSQMIDTIRKSEEAAQEMTDEQLQQDILFVLNWLNKSGWTITDPNGNPRIYIPPESTTETK